MMFHKKKCLCDCHTTNNTECTNCHCQQRKKLLSDIHAMPFDFGARLTIFSIFVVLVCWFWVQLTGHENIWTQIQAEFIWAWAVFYIAWSLMIVACFFIAIGITVMILKDPRTD